jgi:hypothetical protein
MSTTPRWLATVLVLCAGMSIASAPWALDAPLLNFIFKPLATLVVMAHAWPRGQDTPVRTALGAGGAAVFAGR